MNYKDAVVKVMDFLNKNQYCDSIIKSSRSCFNQLEKFLLRKGVVYSPQNAEDWYKSIFESLSDFYKSYYKKALLKLQEVYDTEEVQGIRKLKKPYADLEEYWESILDEYLLQQEEYKTSKTVKKHRYLFASFLIYLQMNDIENISGITYEILIQFYKENICHGKSCLNERISIFMLYLYNKGLVPYGLTVIFHYLSLGKTSFWEEIRPDTHEKIKDIMTSTMTVSVSKLCEYRVILEKEYRKEGYSKTTVTSCRKAIDLLIIFLDMNGYLYNPKIAELWFDDIRKFCGSGVSTFRREICLIATYHESSSFPLASVFKEKKCAFDLIPEWSKEAAYSYVNNKNKVAPKAFVRISLCLIS